ncbi:MAG: IclR family transcriptional regulator [Acidimicrobiales bacterium]
MRSSVSGVGVVDKAILILDTLAGGPTGLAELCDRLDMPRATVHRLAVALECHGLVGRDADGRFLLGSRLVGLGQAAGRHGRGGPTLAEAAASGLAALRDRTGESTQLYVVEGDQRICVAATESPHSLRTIVAVGAALPMDRGSAARVLGGDPAAMRRGWAQSVEEREPGVASVSAPVRAGGVVVAAVSVSGPVERTSRQPGRRYAGAVVAVALEVERALGAAAVGVGGGDAETGDHGRPGRV